MIQGAENCIVNLASQEYFKAVEPYVSSDVQVVTCVFGEEKDGRIRQKGTQVKMARGEMVRYMAENHIQNPEEMKNFQGLGYRYRDDLSQNEKGIYVFSCKSDKKNI